MARVIETSGGRIQGERRDGVERYLGIPFARPPLGRLRFRAPEPAEPWSGVRDATRFGGSAPQNPMALAVLPGMEVGEQNEDCLYLNVYTPAADAGRRPVLVWIHGGAFVIGSGSQAIYDGAPLARRGDTVVVTVNYRLGALGFLRLDQVAGSERGAGGNAAVLDQVAALRWVRENIERFGGDPRNVTIFGESAGGMSVGTLLGVPAAAGLFQRAIPQSGAALNGLPAEQADRTAARFLELCGVAPKRLDPLYELPVEKLLAAQGELLMRMQTERPRTGMSFQPVVDGAVLPELPQRAIERGSAREVSLLVGTTRDEWRLFGALDPSLGSLDERTLVERVAEFVPRERAAELVETYRKSRAERREPTEPKDLALAVETDRIFGIPATRLLEAQLRHRRDAYAYLVTWASPAMGGSLGACHAIELPFVFGTLDKPGMAQFAGSGAEADRLCARMMDAWLSFAREGDPSAPGLPTWRPYETESRATMLLGATCELARDPRGPERRAWDGLLN
jgi:para-nitrobenzyl esterase